MDEHKRKRKRKPCKGCPIPSDLVDDGCTKAYAALTGILGDDSLFMADDADRISAARILLDHARWLGDHGTE